MKINGKSWLVDDELSRRWPIYTRGNVGEVFPDVVTPLNWTLVGEAVEDSWREAWQEFGIVGPADFDTERVIVCIAGGYCYLNMSYIRLLGIRVPGSSVKAVDKQFLGEVSAPPYRKRAGDSNFWCSLKLVWETEKTLRARRPRITEEMRRRSADWVARYPGDDASDEALLDYVFAYPKLHRYLFGRHVLVTFKATVATGAIAALCAMKVRDPGLTLDLLSGVEGVESAEPARLMWTIGRMVAASPALTEVFDRGVTTQTWPQLQSLPEAREFVSKFSEFIDKYGYRGPNEWEFASQPWRMRPDIPLRVIGRLRRAENNKEPGADYEAQLLNSLRAARYARRKLNLLDLIKFNKALPAAKLWQAMREESKSAVIRALDGTRRAINELARRVAERHGLRDPQGVYMLHRDELSAYVVDPKPFLRIIEERLADFRALAERIPPFLFEGEIPDHSTWEQRVFEEDAAGQKGDILEGIGGSPGRVVGIARVVMDASDPDVLNPGDILVAPITDPSWTPLFLAASGVIVDVGAVMSHSVIVARDLGIPCAVSVTDATRIIPDGALIELDGDTGTVTILSVAATPDMGERLSSNA
jgi:phosphohistidine swiveling domain-containing protein